MDWTDLLVATGRTPNTQGIGLEAAGIELDMRSYLKVNERLGDDRPRVWAMGDCAGSSQFTHVAFDDFRELCGRISTGVAAPRETGSYRLAAIRMRPQHAPTVFDDCAA
jgi:pyruvate/2-oxoglutarate dehydrogenase complex dihydrolipoamide dehydrogenase (E3) component